MKLTNLIAAAGLAVVAASAQAQVAIPGLQNTGVAGQGVIDTNYRFTAGTSTATGTVCGAFRCGVATTNGSYPMDVWLPNNATSAWLTPSANQAQSYDVSVPGTYTFTETFDLTGFIPSTASLSGRFLADNSATVQLNGGAVLATANSFSTWTNFSAASGFIAGLNTLTFTVTNSSSPNFFPNPTGLRVEFTASAVTPVPEPSALALTLAGLALVGGVAKRRLNRRA